MISSDFFNQKLDTTHRLIQGDARCMPFIPDESIHLVITAPPHLKLKRYDEIDGKLVQITAYEKFLSELAKAWTEVYRVLVPGGRLVCVVNDIWLSRRKHGRHRVVPLHADICVMCRNIGFDNLNPIIWHKTLYLKKREKTGSKFLGAPYEPNGIIKSDIEFILMQRKPGGYRKPTAQQRKQSKINKSDYRKWFQQFWNLSGVSHGKYPEPFSSEIANRLTRMFSFWGDTVLDPFCGVGTTLVAAMRCNRNSVGIEIDEKYCRIALNRLEEENEPLFTHTRLEYLKL
ncbi:MAG: site-specific DNA-methyltransferase [Deltaproteobacteria bacterium]|nr:site-specific DNA-methyltransferase [Deltaproteobacteria bacterium]MBW2199994.1 site-specific DNA-methyltransferase [Deltaproteobacteria bacterium]MBW2538045.1 site-specific DNA-methyltransferase [Deltaproteobacteria bacterium]